MKTQLLETQLFEPVSYVVTELGGHKDYQWLRRFSQYCFKVDLPETALHLYQEDGGIKLSRVSTQGRLSRICLFKATADQPGSDSLLKISLRKALKQSKHIVVSEQLEEKLKQYLPNCTLNKLF